MSENVLKDDITTIDGVQFSKDLKRIIKYPPSKEGESYEIPGSVEVIERRAFCDCKTLNYIKIPESVIRINRFAFTGCTKLECVDIPKNVEVIEQNAFYACTGLKTFKMHPECKAQVIKPKDINSDGFYGYCGMLFCCCNLEWLFLKDESTRPVEDLKWILSEPARRLDAGNYMLAGAVRGSYIKKSQIKIIARNVPIQAVPSDEKESYVRGFIAYADEYPETIAKGYYDYLKRTINKWIPDFVCDTEFLRFMLQHDMIKKTKVDEVMEGIQKTGDVERTAMMMNYIQEKFGMGFDKYAERMDDKDKEEERKKRQREQYEKKKIELEEKKKDPDADLKDVWKIQKLANRCIISNYKGCAEELVLPEKYEDCTIITVEKSQNYKNQGYNSVKSIVLPESLEQIGAYAFSNCLSLEKVVVPDSVKHIYEGAFLNCSEMKTIVLGKGVEGINYDAFKGCEKLEEIVLPEGVTQITKGLFAGCKNLEKIVVENKESILFLGSGKTCIRGASKAKLYVHKGVEIENCPFKSNRIVFMED